MSVPKRERQAKALLAVTETGDPIFTPAISAAAGVVVRKIFPGCAVRAVIFTDRAPLALGKIRTPTAPVRGARIRFGQTLRLAHIHWEHAALAWRAAITFDQGMTQYLWIALGSALGGVARFALTSAIGPHDFPYATLLVNVTGAFLIGIASASGIKPGWAQFWMVGVLGGYTTFSAFSLQSLELIHAGRYTASGLYMLTSVLLCLAGVVAGQMAARAIRLAG